MKFHSTLIEKLVKVMEVNSGWTGETKLKLALEALNIAVYTQESGKEVLVDRPVPARDVGNFRPASRWAEKEYEEIPFSVIRVQGAAQLLVISGRRNLNGTLFSIENTNCEFVPPQDDEDRFFPYCVLFGNDPYLVFDLVGELLDLRIKLRIKLLKLKLAHIRDFS